MIRDRTRIDERTFLTTSPVAFRLRCAGTAGAITAALVAGTGLPAAADEGCFPDTHEITGDPRQSFSYAHHANFNYFSPEGQDGDHTFWLSTGHSSTWDGDAQATGETGGPLGRLAELSGSSSAVSVHEERASARTSSGSISYRMDVDQLAYLDATGRDDYSGGELDIPDFASDAVVDITVTGYRAITAVDERGRPSVELGWDGVAVNGVDRDLDPGAAEPVAFTHEVEIDGTAVEVATTFSVTSRTTENSESGWSMARTALTARVQVEDRLLAELDFGLASASLAWPDSWCGGFEDDGSEDEGSGGENGSEGEGPEGGDEDGEAGNGGSGTSGNEGAEQEGADAGGSAGGETSGGAGGLPVTGAALAGIIAAGAAALAGGAATLIALRRRSVSRIEASSAS